ncbi:SCO family protein [Pleurocapsales cyanobacterium LEGE 06147]|nr:SCO family protein [Pleurocapsales cyanobacterium LEGE 06147]
MNEYPQNPQLLFYTQLMQRTSDSKVRVTFLPDPMDAFSNAPDFQEYSDTFQAGTLYDGAYGTVWSRISIPSKRPGYLSLYLDDYPVIQNFLAFPTDSIHLVIDKNAGQKIFTGPSYALYELQDRLHTLLEQCMKQAGISIHHREGEEVFAHPDIQEAFIKNQQLFGPKLRLTKIDVAEMLHALALEMEEESFTRELERLILFYHKKMPDAVLDFLQAQTLADYFLSKVGRLQTLVNYAGDSLREKGMIEEFIRQMELGKSMPLKFGSDLPFAEKVLELKLKLAALESNLMEKSLENYLADLKPGLERDLMISKLVFQRIKLGKGRHGQLDSLQKLIAHPILGDKLQIFISHIQPGQPVGSFDFIDEQGEKVSLDQFRGKTLLINTYFTGCSASSSYYHRVLSKLESGLEDQDGLVLISISADRSREKWETGIGSGRYNSESWIRLFSGEQGYSHPFFRKYLISSAPRPLLVDPEGNLIAIQELYQNPERLQQLLANYITIKL